MGCYIIMQKNNKQGFLALIILMLLGIFIISCFAGAYYAGRKSALNEVREVEVVRVDTLIIRDTITVKKPIKETLTKVEKVLVRVTDTVTINDTVYMEADREQVMWEDSLSRVYASGIMPRVDSVAHFITDRYITKEVIIKGKEYSRWGVSINAGYGLGLNGNQVIATPQIGIGISYNLIRFKKWTR